MLKRVNPVVYIALAVVFIVGVFVAYPGPRPIFYPAVIGACLIVLSITMVGIAARREGATGLFWPSLVGFVLGVGLEVLALVRFLG